VLLHPRTQNPARMGMKNGFTEKKLFGRQRAFKEQVYTKSSTIGFQGQ